MFTQDSALVKIWVQQIKDGKYTVDQVPEVSNLKEAVLSLMEG